jgi:hypothetical protein
MVIPAWLETSDQEIGATPPGVVLGATEVKGAPQTALAFAMGLIVGALGSTVRVQFWLPAPQELVAVVVTV